MFSMLRCHSFCNHTKRTHSRHSAQLCPEKGGAGIGEPRSSSACELRCSPRDRTEHTYTLLSCLRGLIQSQPSAIAATESESIPSCIEIDPWVKVVCDIGSPPSVPARKRKRCSILTEIDLNVPLTTPRKRHNRPQEFNHDMSRDRESPLVDVERKSES